MSNSKPRLKRDDLEEIIDKLTYKINDLRSEKQHLEGRLHELCETRSMLVGLNLATR